MSMAVAYGLKKRAKKLSTDEKHSTMGGQTGVHAPAGGRGSGTSDLMTDGPSDAKIKAKNALHQLRNMAGQDRTNLAEGGEVCKACGGGSSMAHGGMVDRIMKSRGGQIANATPVVADFEDNDFDDLVLRDDDLEAVYTGANSGDELGNDQHDIENRTMIDRILASRAKKDRMPRPA